ncbi:class I SAM-dependent DNA methyltransferase [Lacunimicrobium album]
MATPHDFIPRWKASGGAEMANSQSFLNELCDVLGVPRPDPTRPDEALNTYVFEKFVSFNNGDGTKSTGRIDLYRKGAFVLESKQGAEQKEKDQLEALATVTKQKKIRKGTATRGSTDWEKSMRRAYTQAKRYAEAIPEEWPVFLIVADVGFCFDVYADFSQSGKNYLPFPDPQNFRVKLDEFSDDKIRERFRLIWQDPHELDPSRKAAKVTRDLAEKLAKLARRFEAEKSEDGKPRYSPEVVAQFLMRCLFTMFAEDIGLLPPNAFTDLLISRRGHLDTLVPRVQALWKDMDTGTSYSSVLDQKIKKFNGTLFKDTTALPLTVDQLELLIEASKSDWKEVEPAIFGTLLERALDPVERHKLGAHYTPRAYVERLVMPTIMEPLREEWETAYATAVQLDDAGKRKDAVKVLRDFHQHLCNVRVLDPACGSGNFLYVSLELMKRLEGEVINAMKEFDPQYGGQEISTVDPHQFLGIEINPRAAAITDLVLWIGYLQWHFRTRGERELSEPIIRKFDNIENRDAVLAWDAIEPVLDADGNPVTRWDGRTKMIHPVTGEEIPDPSARVPEVRYVNPRKAEWPEAEFIVGNPPFIGTRRMRLILGDGYVTTIADVESEVPKNADYVMYWWHKAAKELAKGKLFRAGLITTNSITQAFNRQVIHQFLNGKPEGKVEFAIPDHPWVDSSDGADVRVAMTVFNLRGINPTGSLYRIVSENINADGGTDVGLFSVQGLITSDLRIGSTPASCVALKSNSKVAYWGTKFYGDGFIVDETVIDTLERTDQKKSLARRFYSGKDLTQKRRTRWVIDCDGLTLEKLKSEYPSTYQHLLTHVKPERDHNPRAAKRERWWIFGENQPGMRFSIQKLKRYFATTETAKHRVFEIFPADFLSEGTIAVIAIEDSFHLGVLSSRGHVVWALAAGGRLGVGNDPRYNKNVCFETFPFPDPAEPLKQRIRDLGEQLDAHRKRQQAQFPDLTMTGMYNVLEKLRSGEALTAKEKTIHEQGLVSVLKQIHDDLDAAVFEAYGWPVTLTDEEILEKLVALNHERAEEEKRGLIRWLRPDFQNPQTTANAPKQTTFDVTPEEEDDDEEETPKKGKGKAKTTKPAKGTAKPKPAEKQEWPKTLPARITAVRAALRELAKPCEPQDISTRFQRANKDAVEELLETLIEVGQARRTDDGRYVA